jgi:hypothetical protein
VNDFLCIVQSPFSLCKSIYLPDMSSKFLAMSPAEYPDRRGLKMNTLFQNRTPKRDF